MRFPFWSPPRKAPEVDPDEVLRLFRTPAPGRESGLDTAEIASLLGVRQAKVDEALAKARAAERKRQGKSIL